MNDLELAKAHLRKNELCLAIALDGKIIFESTEMGVKALVDLTNQKIDISASSVADTVIGKAAATLCIHAGVRSIHADMISEAAIPILRSRGIIFEFEFSVPVIHNRQKDGPCPFERLLGSDGGGNIENESIDDDLRKILALSEELRQKTIGPEP